MISNRPKNRKYVENGLLADGVEVNFWWEFVVPNVKRIKGNKCEECGTTEGRLQIHHLDYVEEVSINTLQLLCTKCHGIKHRKTAPTEHKVQGGTE